MTEKTNEELLLLSKQGNKLAVEELMRRYAGLVRSCARQYFLIGGEAEDVLQEGMIGLYRAIEDFDMENWESQSFKHFARLCITRQIMDAVKRMNRKKNGTQHNLQPLDEQMPSSGLSPEERLILSDEQEEFRRKMGVILSDFEFKVITMYMDGSTSSEICESTGKSAKSVDNAIQRSRRKLMQVFKK